MIASLLQVLIITTLFSPILSQNKEYELVLVQILFRHGERSPTSSYTNDPHINHSWPGGWDQLSNRGKKKMYELGVKLREKYKNYLPIYYFPKDVMIQSSYADRCQMSGQLLAAGMFPPEGFNVWNKNLLWQPIPIHDIPRYLDNKIAFKRKCPKYEAALKKSHESPKMKMLLQNNSELFLYLTQHTGDEIDSIRKLETLYNTLEIEELNELRLPEWTKKVFPDKMKSLAALSLASFTDTQLMKRFHGGILVKEIMDNMVMKMNRTSSPLIYLYSGHDLTVVSILAAFGFEMLVKPDFGAYFIIELYNKEGEYFVEFRYANNGMDESFPIQLQDCKPCRLEKLYWLLDNVMPKNWEEECNEI